MAKSNKEMAKKTASIATIIAVIAIVFIVVFVTAGQTGLFKAAAKSQPPPQPPPKQEIIFDVVYPGFSDLHMQKIRELGVNHLTPFICWSLSEPQNGVYDWSVMDARMQKYTELGMPPAGVVIDWWNCKPSWLTAQETDDVFISELSEFAKAATQRYGDKITYWMIGNEMNGVYWQGPYDPKKVELYKRVSAAAKQGNPKIKVGTRLAFDSWDTKVANWVKFLNEIKINSDFVGVQAYPIGSGLKISDHGVKTAVQMVKQTSGGLPIWVTETGASSCQCEAQGAPTNNYAICEQGKETCKIWVDKNSQATYVYANVKDAVDGGAFAVTVYAYADQFGYSLIDETQYYENNYAFEAKQAYTSYQTVIKDISRQ